MVSSPPISAASPFSSDLPPLTLRDAELLSSLLDLRFNLTALAAQHNLPALDLIHWAASPSIRTYIRSLREVTDECTRLRQSQARRSAIDTLETIATAAEDPIEKRRAASSLLRSDQPRRVARTPTESPPTSRDPRYLTNFDHVPRADGLPDEKVLPAEAFGTEPITPYDYSNWQPNQDYKPVSSAHPRPQYTAEELVCRCVFELLHSDPLQAATNIFPFLPVGAPVFGKPTPDNHLDFLRLHHSTPLYDIINASYEEVLPISLTETAATYTVSLLSGINTLCPGLRVHLERSNSEPHPGCWLITRIDQEQVPWRQPLPPVPEFRPPAHWQPGMIPQCRPP